MIPRNTTSRRPATALAASLLAAALGSSLLAGCQKNDAPAAAPAGAAAAGGAGNAGGAGGARPPAGPTAVGVVVLQTGRASLSTELPGRVSATRVAEVRPQVRGLIREVSFTEGAMVRAGQPLYQIEPDSYRIALDSARASVAKSQAAVETARLTVQRRAELLKIDAVSQQDLQDAQATLKQAEADLASAQAAQAAAQLNLSRTTVTAPISGRVDLSAVTPGALVTANQVQALATVQQLDPIYVDLTQSSADMLRLRGEIAAGRLQAGAKGELPVKLILEDGSEYAAEGRLALSEVTVDEGTGSVTLRAQFSNADGMLLPGMYVRARLPQGTRSDAILVPHKALSRDPLGNALVLVKDGKVAVQPIVVGEATGDEGEGPSPTLH